MSRFQLEQAQREFERERSTVQERLSDARAWCERTGAWTRLTATASTYVTAAEARAAAFARVRTAQARAEADITRLE
jgi:hypothetical protein